MSENLKGEDLLDCSGIVIYGEKGTVLKTSSKNGADVLQLNKIKNITFRNLEITATVKEHNSSGSNGVSITNGFDNITLENIYIHDLPGVDKGYWIDGGKGLTVQNSANSKAYKGTIIAKNIIVENCAYGFRMDTNHISDMMEYYRSFKLDIDIKISKAFQGVSIEFGKATKNIPSNALLDINIKASLNNCQQYVNFVRVVGGKFTFLCDRSQTYKQVLRNHQNKIWSSKDGRVFGFMSGYSKYTRVSMSGNVGEVGNKVIIGVVGTINEDFNLKNSTENNNFYFNVLGTSKDSDIRVISYLGESLNNNNITISSRTAQKLPKEVLSNNNNVTR
ncbi:hypothetical protein [Sphingobacterium sp. IITKGP-BTPF85]|uniref:hypothetical protein n=1 Tax=Sphingobacterium sp. IITKGP-BTPF85 TaxID=1338009 RepID=UPI00038A54A0|nr:hypothetical protein [Sphingobacterium sp. IITKGP-BTPF85]KKX51747.1 hypothetical protein L950_0203830 [Sphingobacterium sp. IITKGP-BTPF85]